MICFHQPVILCPAGGRLLLHSRLLTILRPSNVGFGGLGGVSGACLVHSYDAELVHVALHQAGHVGAARIAFHGGALVPQWAAERSRALK